MKKVRILIVAICVSLMVMGIGYSVWSQTITVNIGGTMGTFKVKAVDAYVVVKGQRVTNDADTSADIKDSGMTVSLTTNKLTPSDYREFRIDFKNVGDCDAVLKKINFDKDSGADDVLRYISVSVNSCAWVKLSDASINMALNLGSGDKDSISVKVRLDSDAENTSIEQPFKITMTPYFAQP